MLSLFCFFLFTFNYITEPAKSKLNNFVFVSFSVFVCILSVWRGLWEAGPVGGSLCLTWSWPSAIAFSFGLSIYVCPSFFLPLSIYPSVSFFTSLSISFSPLYRSILSFWFHLPISHSFHLYLSIRLFPSLSFSPGTDSSSPYLKLLDFCTVTGFCRVSVSGPQFFLFVCSFLFIPLPLPLGLAISYQWGFWTRRWWVEFSWLLSLCSLSL